MEKSARRGRGWIGLGHDSPDHPPIAKSFELGAAGACERMVMVVVEKTVGVVNDNERVPTTQVGEVG